MMFFLFAALSLFACDSDKDDTAATDEGLPGLVCAEVLDGAADNLIAATTIADAPVASLDGSHSLTLSATDTTYVSFEAPADGTYVFFTDTADVIQTLHDGTEADIGLSATPSPVDLCVDDIPSHFHMEGLTAGTYTFEFSASAIDTIWFYVATDDD